MAKISKFNRTDGDPIETVQENVPHGTSPVEEGSIDIPKASFTIMPPKFKAQERLSQQEEYEKVLGEIENAKRNGLSSVIIQHDLQDFAWQKLSQAGYKLSRRVLERRGDYDAANVGELDPNRVEFEINLTEFNRTDI